MSVLESVLEYLQKDFLLNCPFIEGLERGEVDLLNFDEFGAAGLHKEQDILYLSLVSDSALLQYSDLITRKVSTIYGAQDLDFIAKHFVGFRQVPCHQMVYTLPTPPPLLGICDFRQLAVSDAEFVLEIYSNRSFTLDTIRRLIERGLLFGVYVDGEIAGFCGRHREGAMGLLEILPKFRRRGLAKETEKFIIGEVLKEGRIPYGHVVYGNDISLSLQHAIEGVEFAKKMVLWHVLPKLQ